MRNGSRFPVRRGVNANQNLMKSITSSSVGSIRSFEYFKPRYRNLALQQQQQQQQSAALRIGGLTDVVQLLLRGLRIV
jgi:hypothetical protein